MADKKPPPTPEPLPEIFGSFKIVLPADDMNKPKDDKPTEQPLRRD